MGMFYPCLVAALLNGCGFQVFREPMKVGNGPLMAAYMFIFTTFLLLWSVRLYPRSLRRIGKLQYIIEFLAADFLMEDLIIDFWFPLEKWVHDFLPLLAENIEDWVSAGDWSADVITDFLKSDTTGFYLSYVMSSFFLIASLQATRVIDLGTLTQEGPKCFFKEVYHKMKISSRRMLRKFGIGKRKVKINELKNTHQEANPYPCNGILKHSGTKTKNGKTSSPLRNNKGKNRGARPSRFCPLHSPCPKDESEGSGTDDFEDLGEISDMNF